MESRKMLPMNLFVGKDWRGRCREQTCGHSRGRKGWDPLRKWCWHSHTLMCKTAHAKFLYTQGAQSGTRWWATGWDKVGKGGDISNYDW